MHTVRFGHHVLRGERGQVFRVSSQLFHDGRHIDLPHDMYHVRRGEKLRRKFHIHGLPGRNGKRRRFRAVQRVWQRIQLCRRRCCLVCCVRYWIVR